MAANLFKSLFGDDDVDQDNYYPERQAEPTTNNKVVSINSARQVKNTSQISLYEPRLYTDVKEIADQLLNGHAVIINFAQMDDHNAKRVVDFLNGATFAIDGEIKRVGKEIFLCTPKNYEISGNLSGGLTPDGERFTNS